MPTNPPDSCELEFPCTPVPLMLTVCGEPEALSTIESVAVREPVFVGVKVTLIVQVELIPRFDPTGQLFD